MRSALHTGILAVLVVFAGATAQTASAESAITLKNSSQWAIHEMYFSPANTTEWGSDQLGKQTIQNGGSFTLTGIPCAKYDIRLVDEDGDECIVQDVSICSSETVDITDKDLLGCQAKSK